MATEKNNKIILIDADVVSHFIYAGELSVLPTIFKYKIVILDKVYTELERFKKRKAEVDLIVTSKLIEIMPFPEDNEEIKKEYVHIKKLMFKGDGESACLAVARYTENILASSNLKDIKRYCEMHDIQYITTMDFLCQGLRNGIFTMNRCNAFIKKVLENNNKLPVTKMNDWKCRDVKL